MKNTDSTSYVGAHAESQFISFALEQGWEVAHPFIKTAAYDSLIRRAPDVPWETVQIKRAYYTGPRAGTRKRKCLEVGLRRNRDMKNRRAYRDGDFDWLFCYHEDGRWFFPWDMIRGRRSCIQIGSPRYDLWKV
jgi:hypothetical protein